jgi:AmmeMemoRadiSam system protein B
MKRFDFASDVRPSAIAGSWYPDDPGELRGLIEGWMDRAEPPKTEGRLLSLISPHAGYAYSGATAACGYKLLIGKTFDLVVILSPFHQYPPHPCLIQDSSAYETPLGLVPVDREETVRLAEWIGAMMIRHENEHALEIQLPFLQTVLPAFQLLPIMIGMGNLDDYDPLIEALTELVKRRNTLFIASSDMHHIDDYDSVVERDRRVIEALSGFDSKQIHEVFSDPECSVCGKVPIWVVTETCRRLGADRLIPLCRTNSGDVTGEKRSGQYTVGYLSAAICSTMSVKELRS